LDVLANFKTLEEIITLDVQPNYWQLLPFHQSAQEIINRTHAPIYSVYRPRYRHGLRLCPVVEAPSSTKLEFLYVLRQIS
jgi:hypothetical protein